MGREKYGDHERTLRAMVTSIVNEGFVSETPEHETSVMPSRHAWKAFRMGVVASGVEIPKDKIAQQYFWRSMRGRYREWFASYVVGRIRKLESTGSVDLRAPFNPPKRKP